MQSEYLKTLAQSGSLGHAYLFSGNDQAGKEEAIALVCEALLGKGSHLGDLHIVEPKGKEISIGQVRDLELSLALGSWNFPWKVAVLKKAHTMNQEAQSAFLKLLEEPKGSTLFLLETEYPLALLATIRSRAQEIRFWKFPAPQEQLPAKARKTLETLGAQPLFKRFAFAKTLAESQEDAEEFLCECIAYLRLQLMKDTASSALSLVKLAQETLGLIQRTNVNVRLALERLFLAF